MAGSPGDWSAEVRNPQNYIRQRVRVIGVYAGGPYCHEGILLRILPQKQIPDGRGKRIIGPALFLDLERDEDCTVKRPIPTPRGMTPERHVETLKAEGKVAYLNWDWQRGVWQAVVRVKERKRATAIVPCGSVRELHPLDWIDDEPSG